MLNDRIKQGACKILIGVFAAATCFSLLVNLPEATTVVNADGSVAINDTNFPDQYFREYVLKHLDNLHDGVLDSFEIQNVKTISVQNITYSSNNKMIKDLTGIEYFTNLETLDCSSNEITSLDLSNNTKLENLDCWDNHLTYLNVSNCTNLKELFCGKKIKN